MKAKKLLAGLIWPWVVLGGMVLGSAAIVWFVFTVVSEFILLIEALQGAPINVVMMQGALSFLQNIILSGAGWFSAWMLVHFGFRLMEFSF